MCRNIIGICFLILSGFFVYMVTFLSFFNLPDEEKNIKLIMLLIFIAPLAICHVIGLAVFKSKAWQIPNGITLLSGSGFTALVAPIMYFLSQNGSFNKYQDQDMVNFFSDYIFGSVTLALFIITGILSIVWGTMIKQEAQQNRS